LSRKKLTFWDSKISKHHTFSTEVQSEQVQLRANSSIEMVSSGSHRPSEFFNISTANQNQGGKLIFSPRIFYLARKMACFTESS